MKKKNKYVIIDHSKTPITICSGYFTDLQEAEQRCYEWRKKRYANGNLIKEIEYDQIRCDMQYNVVEISDYLF